MEVKEEELMRMQDNLIELRTQNYDYKDNIVRLTEENKGLKERAAVLEKECDKATRAVNRSKKAKEFQVLQEDYDRLTATVRDFEQNATVQNQTLMNELSSIITENDLLKKKLERDDKTPPEEFKILEEEVLHLRAENAVLKTSFQTDGDTETGGNQELELKLATQNEEKKVLTKQLTESKQKYDDSVSELKDQVKQLELKIGHKQELIRTLQNEKELAQYELNLKLESSKTEFQNLRKEFETTRENLTQSELKLEQSSLESGAKVVTLEHELEKLKSQLSLVGPEAAKEFETLKNEHQRLRSDSRRESETLSLLQGEKTSIEDRLKAAVERSEKLRESLSQRGEENQNLQDQLTENIDKVSLLQTRLEGANLELDRVQGEGRLAQKLADSRKVMLDEQSIENQKRNEDMIGKLNEKSSASELALSEHNREVTLLQTQIRDLTEQLEDRISQERTVKKLEGQRDELENKIATLEDGVSEAKTAFETEIIALRTTHDSEIGELSDEINKLTQIVDEKERFILKFGQEKEELKMSFRVGERRNLLMIKELKKQLTQEQKRCQKFQEQMNELKQSSFTESVGEDQESGSIGRNCDSSLSWNMSSSNLTLNETPLQEEHKELIDKLTTAQQQKWVLEEKCNHLEVSNSALNNDLLRKESIIKKYVVSHKADLNPKITSTTSNKSVSRKLLNFVIPEDDEYKDESFRKVQRALEEEMTKNIHLKENLETLTSEMEKLESQLFEKNRHNES